MQQTVLVVGASGVVGTSATHSFLREGWNVVGLSRRAPEIDPADPKAGALTAEG